MSDSTMEQWGELTAHLVMWQHPILPQPTWGQDVAYVAFVIDGLAEANQKRYDELKAVRDRLREIRDKGCHPQTSGRWWQAEINDVLDMITVVPADAE